MAVRFFVFLLLVVVASCGDGPTEFEDYRNIVIASERWEAYELTDYSIDQHIGCFCGPPHEFTVIVKNGEIDDVIVDKEQLGGWDGFDPELIKAEALRKARTIEDVFDLIEDSLGDVATLEVEYDEQFGYPISVYIDQDEMIADEELSITMSNLQF